MSPIKAPRGTKDTFSPEINSWQLIERISSEVLELANYKEIRTPIFEHSELYTKSLGQVTDVVQKEMYSFQDRSERNLTLRPEGTAGVIRSFIEHKLYVNPLPYRVWYCGPMFRYERPQAGRQRQFHQLGLECIGILDPRIDAEIINLALNVLENLKIPNLSLEINSLGSSETRTYYKEALYNYFNNYISDLDTESQMRLQNNPLRLLDSKDTKIKALLEEAPSLLDFLDNDSQIHFNLVCQYLNSLSIRYTINPLLVRGLDYYNKTTFEIKSSSLGSQDTLCGGGRYDGLIQSLGGPELPAIGWAMGIERLLLSIPTNNQNIANLDCYIITLGEKAKILAFSILNQLRNSNLKVDISFYDSNIQKQIRRANQLNATTCIIIGDEEIQKEIVVLKWLKIQKQEEVSLNKLDNVAYKILSS
uniref:histidine-tRNA synthetase n=1 Tax=Chroothece richteriana TaxID=101928 RepID=UPI001FCDDFD9|nr:histidine-tRNA synthetase [Chroothece richteriana]UNJ14280.1 histidine-tRNA synthetase [Chroothece richteriana]